MKIGRRTQHLLRWLLLLPALVAADYLAHAIMQAAFPFLEQRLLPPGVDINDLSIMDEERIFSPYGIGVFGCLAAFFAYLLAPRWKVAAVVVILVLISPLYLGMVSSTLGALAGTVLGLSLGVLADRGVKRYV